jgi:hypothetical protein
VNWEKSDAIAEQMMPNNPGVKCKLSTPHVSLSLSFSFKNVKYFELFGLKNV